MIDLADWLTKQDAADRLGVSTKAIERFTRAGKLEQRFRPQAGSPHVAVYFPDDVEKLAQARQPAPVVPFVVDAETDGLSNGNGHHATALTVGSAQRGEDRLESAQRGEDLFRAIIGAAMKVMSETSQTLTLWVTVKEAAAILGFPQADVQRLIADGDLNCRRTGRGGIRIRRKDLEAL